MKICPMCQGRKVTGRLVPPLCQKPGKRPFYSTVHVTTPVLRINLRCIGMIRDQPCRTCNGSGQVDEVLFQVLTRPPIRLKPTTKER